MTNNISSSRKNFSYHLPCTLDLKGNKFQIPRSFEKFAAADSKIFFLKWKEFDHQKHLKKRKGKKK